MLDSSLVRGGEKHFVDFASVTRVPLPWAVYTKRTAFMCRQTSRISARRLMETMCPLFKTPGAGAPMCSSILHIDAWRVEKNCISSVHFCQAISKQDRQALAESIFVFPSGSPCHMLECIPPQSRLCSRMTFQQHCHFYWFSCCVEGEGAWGDREREGEDFGSLA